MKRPSHVPHNAHIHIPDEWKLAESIRVAPFQWENRWTNGNITMTETALLETGIARFRVIVDRCTVYDYTAKP